MMQGMWAVAALWLGVTLAAAGPDDQTEPSPGSKAAADPSDEVAEKVIVISDGFKRWDRTRWLVQTQVTFPTPYLIQAFRNLEFETSAGQIRLALACEKTFRRNRRKFEVACDVEDIGLQFAALRARRDRADMEKVLQEWDEVLSGAHLQLIVGDDGRVSNVDLEGLQGPDGTAPDADTVRGQDVRESMRVLLRLAMAAFHMRMPSSGVLKEGQWVEYDPELFQIPATRNTMSGSYVIHQLDVYKGHNVVQGKGEGTVYTESISGESEIQNFFKLTYDGVAIYDDDGVMTERVWALKGRASASSALGDLANVGYFHSGRIRQLAEKESVGVGPTRIVGVPGMTPRDDRPVWVPIE